VCATSNQYCHQGFDRINLEQLLDQIHIRLVSISTITRQSYNRHERQKPKEDQSMGAFGTSIQVLPKVLMLANHMYD
jgi:hypothetical protein